MNKTYNKKWTIKRDIYMWKKNYRFPLYSIQCIQYVINS